VFTQLALTNIVFIGCTWFIIRIISGGTGDGGVDFKMYLLLTGTLAFLQAFFASLGLFISAFMRRIRTVLPISMGIVFFFYILFVLNQTLRSEKLAFISPFGYFELAKILASGAYEQKFMITFAVLFVVFISATYYLYTKKDLPSI
jgi:ABC-2 type transport system permease protein